jgi:hypothetical protein
MRSYAWEKKAMHEDACKPVRTGFMFEKGEGKDGEEDIG